MAATIPGSSGTSSGRHVPCASGWCASSARSNGWCGCTLARRRAAVRGDASPAPRAARQWQSPPVRPSRLGLCFRSVFVVVFVAPLFWVWLLLTVCGPSRRRPFRVERSRREPGCRPVGLRRNGAAFARSRPFSRGSRHLLAGSRPAASTGRPQGHPVRRLVLSDGVWRTRVGARPRQRRRRRLTGPGPPVWRPSSSGMRLGAVSCSSHVRSGCWRRQSGHRVSEDGAVGRRFQQSGLHDQSGHAIHS